MITVESLKKRRQKYLAKLEEHELNYQYTGSASTQKTIYEYRDLVEICNLAIEQLSNVCVRCNIHIANAEALMKKYQNYKDQKIELSADEVIQDIGGLRF